MALDIAALTAQLQGYLKDFQALASHTWKGNDAPSPHHFDKGSFVPSAHLDGDAGTLTLSMVYKDGGVPHMVEAVIPLLPAGDTQITWDGVKQIAQGFAVHPVSGIEWPHTLWYNRLVCEFKFTDPSGQRHDLRFDADL